MVLGIVTDTSESQPEKADAPIVSTLLGISIDLILECSNIDSDIDVSPLGKHIDFNDQHQSNAPFSIVLTLLGITTSASRSQSLNAYSPILVTLSGIETCFSVSHCSKARFPILVTEYVTLSQMTDGGIMIWVISS
jgi:hypothetical protein